jgi:polysaccharide export outer membrane protein
MFLRNVIVGARSVLLAVIREARSHDPGAAGRLQGLSAASLARRLPMLVLILLVFSVGSCGTPSLEQPEVHLVTNSLEDSVAPLPETCQAGWSREMIRGGAPRRNTGYHPLAGAAPLHSSGDVVRLDLLDGADFAGVYTINLDGHINVPYAGRIPAAGQTTAGLMKSIKQRLIQKKLFRVDNLDLSVIPIEWARIQISVAGAVFQPGRALTFATKDKEQDNTQAVGDSPPGRFLNAGLLLAGGVRPDADLSQILLWRSGRQFVIDLSGVLGDAPVPDISLMNGDHIEVLSTNCLQTPLARPSQITPSVIRIFYANMSIAPTTSSDQRVVQVPYGSKLIEGAVVANCIGGTHFTNASRRIAYITSEGGRSVVRDIRVRDMLRDPDDLTVNPYMMPNDAIACFDSEVTNIRDIARTMTELLNTYGLVITLF